MITKSYKDLCIEIQLLELRVKDLKREYNFYASFIDTKPRGIRVSTTEGERVTSSKPYMNPEEAYRKCAEINALLIQYDELLTDKLTTKVEMEKGMEQLETLEGKINYYFHVKKMKLYEIADELGYSYEWIREVKSRYERRQNNPQSTHKFCAKV